jgi:phosphoribosyl-AMP cyclohydrolase
MARPSTTELLGKDASCHVGYRSCFYRKVPVGPERARGTALEFVEHEKAFDPKAVYGDAPNPTQL